MRARADLVRTRYAAPSHAERLAALVRQHGFAARVAPDGARLLVTAPVGETDSSGRTSWAEVTDTILATERDVRSWLGY